MEEEPYCNFCGQTCSEYRLEFAVPPRINAKSTELNYVVDICKKKGVQTLRPVKGYKPLHAMLYTEINETPAYCPDASRYPVLK